MLSADFAVQLADAELLVELDDDGFLVVAEEAGEGRGEGFTLRGGFVRQLSMRVTEDEEKQGKQGGD